MKAPCFLVKCGFCLIAKSGESDGIVYGDVRENFTVELYAGKLETVHKTGIRYIVDSCGGVDTRDPKSAEISLFESSADVRVLTGLHYGFARYAIKFALSTKVTFGLLHYFSFFLLCGNCSFNSHCRGLLLLLSVNHVADGLCLCLIYICALAKVSFTFTSFLIKNVVLVLFVSLQKTACGKSEALFACAMGFLFRHYSISPYMDNYFLLVMGASIIVTLRPSRTGGFSLTATSDTSSKNSFIFSIESSGCAF